MNIKTIPQTSFKGYDARPLKGFLMSSNCFGIADEMFKIGKKEGFKIYSPFGGFLGNKCAEVVPPYSTNGNLWAQDYWTIVKNKLLTLKTIDPTKSIMEFFNLKYDITEKVTRETPQFQELNQDLWGLFADVARQGVRDIKSLFIQKKDELEELHHKAHIPGGNIYIVKEEDYDIAFIGEKELEKYDEEDISAMYNVEDVIPLPQMDYHIDLFMRPLDDYKILLADDEYSMEILRSGSKKLEKYLQTLSGKEYEKTKKILDKMNTFINNFKGSINYINNRPQVDEIAKIFKDEEFEVIRVPGRIYEAEPSGDDNKYCHLKHFCNYINANVLVNKDGELVYITNKSNIDELMGLTPELSQKIGFSFEEEFIKAIKSFVKREHIYFVDGKENFISKIMLPEYEGGIHCVCSEVPENG